MVGHLSSKRLIDDTLLVEYLKSQQCEVFPVSTGNCYYRCIACEEDLHMRICDIIVKFVSSNQLPFSAYHMPQDNATTIEEHLHAMSKCSTWATEL